MAKSIFTVNVSNLMNKTVFPGLCTDIDNLIVGDVRPFPVSAAIISHISNGKTIFWVVGAAVVPMTRSARRQEQGVAAYHHISSGTRDMLNSNGVIDLLNRALIRNDAPKRRSTKNEPRLA